MEKKSTIHREVLEEDIGKAPDQIRTLVNEALALMEDSYPRWRVHGVQTEFNRKLERLIDEVAESMD